MITRPLSCTPPRQLSIHLYICPKLNIENGAPTNSSRWGGCGRGLTMWHVAWRVRKLKQYIFRFFSDILILQQNSKIVLRKSIQGHSQRKNAQTCLINQNTEPIFVRQQQKSFIYLLLLRHELVKTKSWRLQNRIIRAGLFVCFRGS